MKDEMLLEHFIFEERNIYIYIYAFFLVSYEQISHIPFYFHFLFSPIFF